MDLLHKKLLGEEENWWFKAKNELVKSFIRGKSLDIGGGLNQLGDVIIDNDEEVLKKNPKAKKGNAYGLPVEDNSFDTVIFSDVLEHLKHDYLAVKEAKKALKKNGRVIVTVPAYQFLFSEHDDLLGHYRRYTKGSLKKVFEEQGFKTVKLSYWNFFLFPGVVLVKLSTDGLNLNRTNSFINQAFYSILRLENRLIKKINFPYGGTVFGVFEK